MLIKLTIFQEVTATCTCSTVTCNMLEYMYVRVKPEMRVHALERLQT